VKKLLITALVLVLSVGMIGSAFAYFSDTEESTGNTYNTGTLDLVLNDGDPDVFDDGAEATWTSPDWKPGEEDEAILQMQNSGSIGSKWLWFKTVNLSEYEGSEPEPEGSGSPHDIASQIIIKEFQISWNGVDWAGSGWASGWMADVWGDGSPLTLAEFASGPYGVCICAGAWEEGSGGLLLANSANTWYVKMLLQFDPDADNDYQADYCTFDFGVKTWNGASTGWQIGTFSPEAYGYGEQP
jgi:predicted ribosomally synthesized peptide with SipW-like signal peptide